MVDNVRRDETKRNETPSPVSFSFGQNWAEFIATRFSDAIVDAAKKRLLDFLELPDLKGKYFLDIGSGSGLHSLAAFRSGADRIVSFDLDPASVATTTKLRDQFGSADRWEVLHGSALDKAFLARIEPADIAYSWGVLHHTGSMWEAVENAAKLAKPDGMFFVALYTTTPKSGYWLETKKRYNAGGELTKRWLEARYLMRHLLLPCAVKLRNPFRILRETRDRGMDYMTDVRDWLGGLPYEDATPQEVLRFGRNKLGMELINIATGEACSEYLFRRLGH